MILPVRGQDVWDYIPQRPPFVFIDDILKASMDETLCRFTPNKDTLFVSDDLFREEGMVEHVAQTGAAGVGFFHKSRGMEVPLGFIGAVKNAECIRLPEINTSLITRVTVMNRVFNATVARGEVFDAKGMVFSCDLNIFLDK